MNSILKNSMLLTSLMFILTGCVTSPMPPNGMLFSNLMGPNRALEGKLETNKIGESCASSVLGLVAWGDASIDAARKAGQITNIAAVDYRNFNVMAVVFTKTCAIVSGS